MRAVDPVARAPRVEARSERTEETEEAEPLSTPESGRRRRNTKGSGESRPHALPPSAAGRSEQASEVSEDRTRESHATARLAHANGVAYRRGTRTGRATRRVTGRGSAEAMSGGRDRTHTRRQCHERILQLHGPCSVGRPAPCCSTQTECAMLREASSGRRRRRRRRRRHRRRRHS
jgi:hypothetical protein